MRKLLKSALLFLGLSFLLLAVYIVFLLSSIGFFPFITYSKEDLVENYISKTKEIEELKHYINSVVPINRSVEIEFDDRRSISIFHVTDRNGSYRNWGLKVNSPKMDSLLLKLGWSKQTLATIKEKLDEANCISVKSGEPCNIGFKRSGMGQYFYNLFEQPIEDSLIAKYNDSCRYIFYSKKVVLEYGGGGFGRQCFSTAE